MFRSYYAVTKDRKGGIHQFRLTASEGVPRGQEIIDLKVAGQFGMDEMVSKEDIDRMYDVAAVNDFRVTLQAKKVRRKRAPKE